MKNKKLLLVILDGWGLGPASQGNAIVNARTPNMDKLVSHYPSSELKASGEAVGLPRGIMGNSEVGHLNIGAGRVVLEDLVKINEACQDKTLGERESLQEAFHLAHKKGRSLHFIGLLSDAGVHSMNTHLYRLCELAKKEGLKKVYIHAFSDGRDTNPKSGTSYVRDLEKHLEASSGELASLIGRYYGMDRDQRWERTAQAYQLLVKGKGKKSIDIAKTMEGFYKKGITDEFMEGIVKVGKDKKPIAVIKNDDVVVCFNFRTDRLRQLTTVLTQRNFFEPKMSTLKIHYYTMTTYDKNFRGVKAIFPDEDVKNTLGEILSKTGLKQLRLAETEKYPHVTFFFSGRRQTEFIGEKRIVVPSPLVATYDLQPEMSALLIKKIAIRELIRGEYQFICLNFANADMVGHTSVYPAVIKAIETLDACLGELIKIARAEDYDVLIIADHGNAEQLLNDDGSVNTRHSINPVPCILVTEDYRKIKKGKLADVAPTILKIMGVDIPKEMKGKVLV